MKKFFFKIILIFIWLNSNANSITSVNRQPSTVNQFSTSVNRQPSTVNQISTSVNRQPSTVNQFSTSVNRQPSTVNHIPSTEINRTAYYKAMEENDKVLVNAQLLELESAPPGLQKAFKGAMLMKKAGLVSVPANKLKLFRQGHRLLEMAIRDNPYNAEFRFLRLIVQEHAPGALHYNNDIQIDRDFIESSYKSLPEEVQHIIADYNKKSKNLKPGVS
jgi:hypothetical protein